MFVELEDDSSEDEVGRYYYGGVNDAVTIDVDGDGDLDVATAEYGANRVWINDGTGTLTDSGQELRTEAPEVEPVSEETLVFRSEDEGDDSFAIVAIDVDSDGDADLATAGSGPSAVWVNDGAGVFSQGQQLEVVNEYGYRSSVSYTFDIVSTDTNGDGHVDLVTGGSDGAYVWVNNGSGIFADGVALQLPAFDLPLSGPGSCGLGECGFIDDSPLSDEDLIAEELFSEELFSETLTLIPVEPFSETLTAIPVEPLSEGCEECFEDIAPSPPVYSVLAADVDADGDADLVTAGYGVTIWMNDGTGEFSASPLAMEDVDGDGIVVAIDIEADGDVDLAASGEYGNSHLWVNDGSGGFTAAAWPSDADDFLATLAVDVDDDGDSDLVTSHRYGPGRIWLNDGTGQFTGSDYALADTGYVAASGDLNGDGHIDLAIVSRQNIELWVNTEVGCLLYTSPSPRDRG